MVLAWASLWLRAATGRPRAARSPPLAVSCRWSTLRLARSSATRVRPSVIRYRPATHRPVTGLLPPRPPLAGWPLTRWPTTRLLPPPATRHPPTGHLPTAPLAASCRWCILRRALPSATRVLPPRYPLPATHPPARRSPLATHPPASRLLPPLPAAGHSLTGPPVPATHLLPRPPLANRPLTHRPSDLPPVSCPARSLVVRPLARCSLGASCHWSTLRPALPPAGPLPAHPPLPVSYLPARLSPASSSAVSFPRYLPQATHSPVRQPPPPISCPPLANRPLAYRPAIRLLPPPATATGHSPIGRPVCRPSPALARSPVVRSPPCAAGASFVPLSHPPPVFCPPLPVTHPLTHPAVTR